MDVPIANFFPCDKHEQVEVFLGLYNIYRPLLICEGFEGLKYELFPNNLGLTFHLDPNPIEANQSRRPLKSHQEPRAHNPAVENELLGSVLPEASRNWTTGTGAHLEIKVGASFPEAFAWAEEHKLSPSEEFKLYRLCFLHNSFWDGSMQWCIFCLKNREQEQSQWKTNIRISLAAGHLWFLCGSSFIFYSVSVGPCSLLVSFSPLPSTGPYTKASLFLLTLIDLPPINNLTAFLSNSHRPGCDLMLSRVGGWHDDNAEADC